MISLSEVMMTSTVANWLSIPRNNSIVKKITLQTFMNNKVARTVPISKKKDLLGKKISVS